MDRFFRAVEYETETVLSSFEFEPIGVSSIYIGGGTPSLIDPGFLERWLAVVSAYVQFLPGYEFTVEANPESLTAEFAAKTFGLGVNRIVIGVQSFRSTSLKLLNRKQTNKQIDKAFYLSRAAGYENVCADLIFGLPAQQIKHMKQDITRLMALEPKHISFYQLTVEDGTPLARQIAEGKIRVADEDDSAAMYRYGSHMLIDGGYQRYEVSNFALDGFASRHNRAYWEGATYIGLGPAAHGFVNEFRYGNIADVSRYMDSVEAGQAPAEFVEELTFEQEFTERVMLALRTADGLEKVELLNRFGERALALLEGKVANRLIASGHLELIEGFLRLTDDGFLVADRIIADLLGEI